MQRRRHRRTRRRICVGVDAGWTSSDVVLAGALDVRFRHSAGSCMPYIER